MLRSKNLAEQIFVKLMKKYSKQFKEEHMKILKAVIIATVLLLLPVYAFSSELGYMRISLMEGDVQIKTQDSEDWGYASINGPIEEGDQLWVPDGGRLELQLNTGTYIRLDQDSAIEILSMDKNSSQFYLSQGHAYINDNAPEGNVIQVDTPHASTRAFSRAVFRIDIPDEYTDVAVYSGYVETENQVGKTTINAGEMLSLGQDTNGEVAPMGQPDEWEQWNTERNDRIFAGRAASSGYLPSELREYSYDFDSYGKWMEVPEYGRCWTPATTAGESWAPYREGRWMWRDGDYVWVAYEPWGWAPYHYGRWAFAANIGWCWVPPAAGAVYWGPGYVGWVRTEDYVAWVPLAPGETYYGHGYYGPHSVNITNININQVRITQVYKNVHINHGVTVVSRNTFATGSHKIVNVDQNIIRQKIFVRDHISVGTPAIKPSKASYGMSAKPVPAAKLPPHRIRTLQVKELKQSRPFMREPHKSVLHPGSKPETLPLKTIATPKTRGKRKPVTELGQPPAKEIMRAPAGDHAPKEEGRITIPEKRFAPEGRPAPKEEKRITIPEKRLVPEGRPVPKEEKRLTPTEKRLVPEGRPAPKEEKHLTPTEKRLVPEVRTTPKEEKHIKPPEQKIAPEGHPATQGGKKRDGSKQDKKKTEEDERLK
jgi:Family of unknown function (DUF6600)/FecR protein